MLTMKKGSPASSDFPSYPLTLEFGSSVPEDLKRALTAQARKALTDSLAMKEDTGQLPLLVEVPHEAVLAVRRAMEAYLATGLYNNFGVQERPKTLFVGDDTPESPAPAPGMWEYGN